MHQHNSKRTLDQAIVCNYVYTHLCGFEVGPGVQILLSPWGRKLWYTSWGIFGTAFFGLNAVWHRITTLDFELRIIYLPDAGPVGQFPGLHRRYIYPSTSGENNPVDRLANTNPSKCVPTTHVWIGEKRRISCPQCRVENEVQASHGTGHLILGALSSGVGGSPHPVLLLYIIHNKGEGNLDPHGFGFSSNNITTIPYHYIAINISSIVRCISSDGCPII